MPKHTLNPCLCTILGCQWTPRVSPSESIPSPQNLHNRSQYVYGQHQTHLGWAKGYSVKKRSRQDFVLPSITSICMYNVALFHSSLGQKEKLSLKNVLMGESCVFGSILWGSRSSSDHPEKGLAKFGYKNLWKLKIKTFFYSFNYLLEPCIEIFANFLNFFGFLAIKQPKNHFTFIIFLFLFLPKFHQ